MITCKEDLVSTYIEKGDPELTSAYLDACKPYVDVHLSINDKYKSDAHFYFHPEYSHIQSGECDVKLYRKITLSDLKPRTRTEYVKSNMNIMEIIDYLESGNKLYTSDNGNYHVDAHIYKSWKLGVFLSRDFYIKVETPITEREEFIKAASEAGEYHGPILFGKLFDAGCRFK